MAPLRLRAKGGHLSSCPGRGVPPLRHPGPVEPRHPTTPHPQVAAPLNESWPDVVPTLAPRPLEVVATLVWPEGPVEIPTRALRWTSTHVLVAVHDPRLAGRWAVWLPAGDVRRR